MTGTARKARVFWPILLSLVIADCATKQLAETHLPPVNVPHPVLGSLVNLTLAYNLGAATGITLGSYSRWGFSLLTVLILALLSHLYQRTRPEDRWQLMTLALVCGGAIGNLIDRVRSPRGVVDFIDIGLGAYRFWTFNLADVAVTLGATGLACLLWRKEARGESLSGGDSKAAARREP